jgi:gliding motility-associated-like protein
VASIDGNYTAGEFGAFFDIPVLIATSPENHTVTAVSGANIVLTFSENMSQNSVDGGTNTLPDDVLNDNIQIRSGNHANVPGIWSGDGTTTLTFDPTSDFDAGEVIQITLTTAVQSSSAIGLQQPLTTSFIAQATTGPATPDFFREQVVSTGAGGAFSVHVGDVDGDGDLDILSASQNDNKISWYANDGTANPTFTEQVVSSSANTAHSVHAADVDGDGDLDILSASVFDFKIAWYENDGATIPSFTEQVVSVGANNAESVHVGDMDGDGDLDILSASSVDDKIAWYENNGGVNPTFFERTVSTSANSARSVYVGDLDGDGDLDILSASANDAKIAWYENDGAFNPVFTEQVVTTTANGAFNVKVGDVDGDGDLDILSAVTLDNKIAWYENDGATDPTFTEQVVSTVANGARSVHASDVDGDGDLDLLSASNVDDKIAWYENDGSANPIFTEHVVSTAANDAVSVFVGDVDGDGDMDILSASATDNKIAWYENANVPPNTQATNVNFSNIGATQMDIGWTNGNGTNRLVLVHEGSAVDADPVELTAYVANANFGSGTQIGTGNYVVYNGSGNNVTITGMTQGETYHVRVYEYNGTATDENYNVNTASGNPNNLTLVPEISVFVGLDNTGTPITDAQVAAIDLGSAILTNDIIQSFAIENIGNGLLDINDIVVTGTGFGIDAFSLTTLLQGNILTFDVTLSGATIGDFNGSVQIDNTDADEHPFTFDIAGSITAAPEPEINLYQGSDNAGTGIANAQPSAIDFGSATTTNDIVLTFAIENTGIADLIIAGITMAGTDFVVSGIPGTIAAGSTETFVITLDATTAGVFNDQVTIVSDDADENPFTFDVTGTITVPLEPEINLYLGTDNAGAVILDAQTAVIDLGSALVTNDIVQTFAIENTGNTDLVISSITIGGLDFAVSSIPTTIAAGMEDTFVVTLDGATTGVFNEVVAIVSNDVDENPFTFIVTGTISNVALPDIEVLHNSLPISGIIELLPAQQNDVVTETFEIHNNGNAMLNISDITSANPAWTVQSISLPNAIAAAGTSSFDLVLNSSEVGLYESMITILSDDPDQSTFTFDIRAVVEGAQAVVVVTNPDNSVDRVIITNQDIDLGQTKLNVNIEKVFGIENLSTTEEILVHSISVDNAVFEVMDFSGIVPSNDFMTFTILLRANDIGQYSANVNVSTSINDFSFVVTGEVTSDGDPNLNIYNVITPNGDEVHDFFKIGNITAYPDNQVIIYNRWGDKVFEARGYDNNVIKFSGISNNGSNQELDEGNYYYAIDKGNGGKKETGYLLLKR